MPETYCPNCDATVKVGAPKLDMTVKCGECGVSLEVISTDPFEVDFPLDYDQGWEDDEGDDW